MVERYVEVTNEYVKQLEQEIDNLKKINEEHKKINGELREENQKYKEVIEKAIEYLTSYSSIHTIQFGTENDSLNDIELNKTLDEKTLNEMTNRYLNKFKVVSFDNLCTKQLNVKNIIGEERWKECYMGDDGTHTFYIDLVKKKFARTSISEKQYDLLDNIDDMFKIIRGAKKWQN